MPSTTASKSASDTRAVSTSGAPSCTRAINSSSVIRVEAILLVRLFFRAIPAPGTAMLAAVACWRLPAEAVASVASSASCYDVFEDIRILSIVKAERKFVQVQRQILLGHFVVVADDSAFEQ